MEIHANVSAELIRLQKRHDGKLRPEDVLEAAKNVKSPLHDCFEWDDSKAAHLHRIDTARTLIRAVYVEHYPSKRQKIRAFVSLPSDRASGAGYRSTVEVLNDATLRKELIQGHLDELETLFKRMEVVDELSPFVAKMRQVAAVAWTELVSGRQTSVSERTQCHAQAQKQLSP